MALNPPYPPPDWEALNSVLPEQLAAARQRVGSWFWADADADLDYPYALWPERFGRTPNSSPARTPKPDKMVEYGQAADGDILIARRRLGAALDDPILEERLWAQTPDGRDAWFVVACASGESTIEQVAIPVPTRHGCDEVITWHNPQTSTEVLWRDERYRRDNEGRVIALQTMTVLADSHPQVRAGGEIVLTSAFEATWDATGLCDVRRIGPDGEANVMWRRTDATAVAQAEALLQRRLPDAIRAWAKRCAPDAAAYCLVIAYDDESGIASAPSLAIGTVEDLSRFGPPGSGSRRERMWNPAEFALFDVEPAELATGDLRRAIDLAQQHGRDLAKTYRATAARLRKDSKPILEHAVPELGVLCVDLELGRLATALREATTVTARRTVENL